MTDRTIHGIASDGVSEVVRYDRAGKWFIESPTGERQQVTVGYAAHQAALGEWYPYRAGGQQFDAKVRRERAVLGGNDE